MNLYTSGILDFLKALKPLLNLICFEKQNTVSAFQLGSNRNGH